ncbi:MAG TPA: RDD family protein [Kofleriaceae bacterium]
MNELRSSPLSELAAPQLSADGAIAPRTLGSPPPPPSAKASPHSAEAAPPQTQGSPAAPSAYSSHPTPPPAPSAYVSLPFSPGHAATVPATTQAAVRSRREATPVHVVGFWRRLLAAVLDLAIVIPAALIITMLASGVTGLHLPGNLHLFDIDLWIDLVLATDPALVMGLVLFCSIGLAYLLVFQIIVGRTLGMRVLHIKIIDVYGDRPSPARCVARCAGYIAGIVTLFLGFLWMGFDSEKRGLQDWIAGTYVIRA